MKKHNETIEAQEFSLIFNTIHGHQHIEKGQTFKTMGETIADYLENYEIFSIEMVAVQEHKLREIELAFNLPF